MKTFKIRAILGNDWGLEEVQGEPVVFKGFEEFQWFVYQYGRSWRVAEVSAGSRLPLERNDKTTAISAAATFLRSQGIEEVRRVVSLSIEKFGGVTVCD